MPVPSSTTSSIIRATVRAVASESTRTGGVAGWSSSVPSALVIDRTMHGLMRNPPEPIDAIAVSIWSGVTTIDWPIDIIACDRPDQERPPGT